MLAAETSLPPLLNKFMNLILGYSKIKNDLFLNNLHLHCVSFNCIFMAFNLWSGTKFQQATQVCHHEAAVRCNNEEEGGGQEERNKNSRIVSSR